MAEGNHRHKGFKPAQKLFAGLAIATLTLLWHQLLSDLRFRHADPASAAVKTRGGEPAIFETIKIRDVDLGPKVESLRLSIEAAQLVYNRCSQATVSTLEGCFSEIFDEEYHTSRTMLPIAEALSMTQGQAKEVSYTVPEAMQREQREGERQGKFYCLNPALSSTEKSMWTVITKADETPEHTRHLTSEVKDRVCREQARF